MKRMIVALAVMICTTVLLISEKASSAVPIIDRFIGQVRVLKEVRGASGEHKGRLFILYHGDSVIMERDNKTGKVWIIGVYQTTANAINKGKECVISFQRKEISRSDTAFGVLINGRAFPQCSKSAN
ncbi:MAG: hypothetical protein NUV61_01385 [Candidatus Azambacteria bacterium]|nr:hypothetical protein [Candidatus Azambacteria bacterium]